MEPTQGQETTANPTSETPPSEATESVATMPEPTAKKADLGKRFLAMLIDGVLAGAIAMIPFVGWIVAGAYMVVRDGLELDFMNGRSVGKKVMKLRPVRLDGEKMTIESSFRRNWMWAIGYLSLIPIIGWLLSPVFGIASLAIGLFEVYKVLSDSEGRRWGDGLAGTMVIEVNE